MSNVPSVYVCSIDIFSGKSTLCLGLALRLRDEGYKVGYFKPVGWEMARGPKGEIIDEDAHLMRSVLGLDLPLDTLVPVIFNSRFLEEGSKMYSDYYEKRLLRAYDEASRGMDLMVLEGPHTLGIGAFAGIDPGSIAKKLESQLVLVSRVESDVEIDQLIREYKAVQAAGVDLLGAVLNIVPKPVVERIRWFALPILRKHRVNILGIV
ncbi:MAG: AAA family ATPase, partial [Candidatus Bathyarchaeia archaeon]